MSTVGSLILAVLLASPIPEAPRLAFFYTSSAQPYGLTDPALAFQPTLVFSDYEPNYPGFSGVDSDVYHVSAFPPLEAAVQTPNIDWTADEFAYVWVRFTQAPNNAKIQGLHLVQDGTPADLAYYVVNNTNNEAIGDRRWDGAYTSPYAPEFKLNPQILAAVQTRGIVNRSGASDAWNLYDNVTRTTLLGAIRYDSDGLRSAAYGSLGAPGFLADFGSANWIPEPAGLTLLVIISVTARRCTP